MSISKLYNYTTSKFAKLTLFGLLLLAIGSAGIVGITTLSHAATPSYQWTEIFTDNFDGATLSTANWKPYHNTYGDGNDEIACLTPNNVAVSGGTLKITAKRENVTCPGKRTADNFTSGFIGSREVNKYYPAFARYEVRAKTPHGQGLWPGFWLRHTDGAGRAEIDVLEYFHATNPGSITQTVHFPAEIGSNVWKKTSFVERPTDASGWHTYAVEITPANAEKTKATISMFIDNVKTFEYTPPKSDWLNKYDKNAMFDIALNMAVGGKYTGHPDDELGYSRSIDRCLSPWMGKKPCDKKDIKRAAFPATYEVDYVKVSKLNSSPAPAPDKAAPKISITSPANNSSVSGKIQLSANASDNVGIRKVHYFVDGKWIGASTTSPYAVEFDTKTISDGNHTITTEVYDISRNLGTSTPVTITVRNSTTSYVKLSAGSEKAAEDWSADSSFTSSKTAQRNEPVSTTKLAAPAAPQGVYQTERYGNFSYNLRGFDPAKTFVLTLHFNEFYWNEPAKRIFDVSANGQKILKDFDILREAGGKNIAIAKTFALKPDASGNITLSFETKVDNAKVSGISLVPLNQ